MVVLSSFTTLTEAVLVNVVRFGLKVTVQEYTEIFTQAKRTQRICANLDGKVEKRKSKTKNSYKRKTVYW